MSFVLKNSLCTYDEKGQPYSLSIEKDAPYYHLSGQADKNGYAITFSGTRAYINTPSVRTFSLQFNLLHVETHCKGFEETFVVLFGYDRFTRRGYQLELTHMADNTTRVRLLKRDGQKRETLKEKIYPLTQECDVKYPVTLTVTDNAMHCELSDCVFDCDIEVTRGKIAFTREAAFRELVVSDLVFQTEEIKEQKQAEYTVVLPRDNGAELPYELTLTLSSLGEGVTKIDYVFGGGLWGRTPVEKVHGEVWATPYNDITGLYVKLNDQKRLYMENGTFRVLDSNYMPKDGVAGESYAATRVNNVYRAVMTVLEAPLCGSFLVNDFGKVEEITVGYDNFLGFGAEFYAGERQFVYDTNGNLLYNGKPLDTEFSIDVKSPLNKALADAIPETAVNREAIIHHLEGNHYFYTETENDFFVDVRSTHGTEFLSVNVSLQDAFLRPIKKLIATAKDIPNQYAKAAAKSFGIHLEPLPLGVYHLSVEICYFGKVVKEHHSAFEVIDPNSEISPQEASGIFDGHVGDAAPMGLTTFCPDPWSSLADFNVGHYIHVAQVLPCVANERRVWEVYPLFKRKLFAWMNTRAVRREDILDGTTLSMGVTQNADYIYNSTPAFEENALAPRYDFFVFSTFKQHLLGLLERYLEIHPEIKQELGLGNVRESFTLEEYKNFMHRCVGDFVDFCLPLMEEKQNAAWAEIKKVNPKAKRMSYGIYNPYVSTYVGAYSARWYGANPFKAYEFADGYQQFEDYPHDCNYSTTRGAWGLTTAKLLDPRAKLYPELYDSFREGCPDTAIACSRPPVGYFPCKPYLCTTQVYEYIFNTARYAVEQGGYDYWRDYGIMMYSLYVMDPKPKLDEFMPAWGIAMDNKPAKPKKGAAFLYEITSQDDRFDPDKSMNRASGGGYGWNGHCIHNISDAGLGFVNLRLREAGLPVNSVVNYAGLAHLTPENCDMLVLPSLKNADKKVIDTLRKLHAAGVPLIATHDVTGLEDLFGVTENRHVDTFTSLTDGKTIEPIVSVQTEIFYDAVDAEVLLKTNNNTPVLLRKGNAVLINAPVCQIGIDSFYHALYITAHNISALIENTLTDTLRNLSTSEYLAPKRCGITPFVNEKGEDMLLLIDYSKDLDDATYEKTKPVTVQLPAGYTDVVGVYGADEIGKSYKNGTLSKVCVDMLRQQSVLLKLVK